MSFIHLFVLAGALGASSFLVGSIPLVASLSRKNVARFSLFGTGLLLGSAIGVIIPEGIESIYDSNEHTATPHPEGPSITPEEPSSPHASEPPTFEIALSLLFGFTLMLVVEQLASLLSSSPPRPNATALDSTPFRASTSHSRPLSPTTTTSIADGDLDLDLDAEIAGLEAGKTSSWSFGPGRQGTDASNGGGVGVEKKDPRLMTFGLIIHSIADGLALGASIASGSGTDSEETGDSNFSGLSLVVFIALAIHKAPASLALTSTLMAHLPTRVVRTHLIAFSLAAPVSAFCTYCILRWLGTGELSKGSSWTGEALLFSGGSFLYVATLLSSLPQHTHVPGESSSRTGDDDPSPLGRLGLIIIGIFSPALVAGMIGHGH